jgi:hypothetical protein
MSVACTASHTESYVGKIERTVEYDDGHFCVVVWDEDHKLYKPILIDDTGRTSDVRGLLTGHHHVRGNGQVTVETTTRLLWFE